MNRGLASCKGAVTIMNAIPLGRGAAMGIDLQTDVEVTMREGKPQIIADICEKGEDDRLVKECVRSVFDKTGLKLSTVSVCTISSIPISRGLKSSSATANAIFLATLRALNREMDDLDIVKSGVEAAKRAEVTVTGAFDDASACYFGGVVVTDNNSMEIIRKDTLRCDEPLVILHIPNRKIRKKGLSANTFESVKDDFKEVERLVEDADYLEALTLNGVLCSEALRLSDEVARIAMDSGALAAGLSGTGPATAIICDNKSFKEIMASIPSDDAAIIFTELNETAAPEVIQRL